MKRHLQTLVFLSIGLLTGLILSLQVRADPVPFGSSPQEELDVRKSLLSTFSLEQEQLKKEITAVSAKRAEAQRIIESRSSSETRLFIKRLHEAVGLFPLQGEGMRITLFDNPTVARTDFSALNENFVQASDLRDLINALFLKDAKAIALNGRRIGPLTPIQSVFDSIFVGNFQITPPFVLEAIGNPAELKDAFSVIRKRKIQFSQTGPINLVIPVQDGIRPPQFLSLAAL